MAWGRYIFGALEPTRPLHVWGEDGLQFAMGAAPTRDCWMPAGSRMESAAAETSFTATAGHGPMPAFTMLAGDSSGIYVPFAAASACEVHRFDLESLAHSDVTKTGGYSGFSVNYLWSVHFAAYGASLVLSLGAEEELQVYDVGTSKFVDLVTSTTKPRGRYPFSVGSHLFLARMESPADDLNAFKFWWSAAGDGADFEPGSGNAGFAYLYASNGRITGAVGREDHGIIFQERAVTRIQRGVDSYFEPFTIARGGLGCVGQQTIVDGPDGAIYYRAQDGFARVDPSGSAVDLILVDNHVAHGGLAGTSYYESGWKGIEEDVYGGERSYGFSIGGFVAWKKANGTPFGSSPYGGILLYSPHDEAWTTVNDPGGLALSLIGVPMNTVYRQTLSYPMQDIGVIIATGGSNYELRVDRGGLGNYVNYSACSLETHPFVLPGSGGEYSRIKQIRLIYENPGIHLGSSAAGGSTVSSARSASLPTNASVALRLYGGQTESVTELIKEIDVGVDEDDTGFVQLQGSKPYRSYRVVVESEEFLSNENDSLAMLGVEFEYEIVKSRR